MTREIRISFLQEFREMSALSGGELEQNHETDLPGGFYAVL